MSCRRPAETVWMRFRILAALIIGAGCLWSYQTLAPEAEPQETDSPDPPITSRAAEGGEAGQDWSKLDPTRLWEEQTREEPPPDPLVHCRLGGGDEEDTFLRSSECERREGDVLEEPDWAKTD
jgi:hypothetical protein